MGGIWDWIGAIALLGIGWYVWQSGSLQNLGARLPLGPTGIGGGGGGGISMGGGCPGGTTLKPDHQGNQKDGKEPSKEMHMKSHGVEK